VPGIEVVEEDGDLGVTREQMCEVGVRVRVFLTRGALSVTRLGHRVGRGGKGRTKVGVGHHRKARFDA
jgi:hypothetical protein